MGRNKDLTQNLNIEFSDPVMDQGSLTTEEWLTAEMAAKYLKVSVPSLRNMTSNGQIPFYKLGGRNRYLLSDLRKLLLSEKRGGFRGI